MSEPAPPADSAAVPSADPPTSSDAAASTTTTTTTATSTSSSTTKRKRTKPPRSPRAKDELSTATSTTTTPTGSASSDDAALAAPELPSTTAKPERRHKKRSTRSTTPAATTSTSTTSSSSTGNAKGLSLSLGGVPEPSSSSESSGAPSLLSPRMTELEVEDAKQKLLTAVIGRDTYHLQALVKNVRKATKGDLSYREGKDGLTLLHRAVIQGGDTLVAEQLINNGAKVNMGDNHERTALFHAVSRGDMAAIKLLIERQADVCLQDADKQNVLHVVAKGGREEALEYLLEHSAHAALNVEDKDGMTPLHYAVNNDMREIVRILLAAGADANARNYLNRKPSDMISRVGSKTPEAKWIAKQLKKQERRQSAMHAADEANGRSHSLVHRLLGLHGEPEAHVDEPLSSSSTSSLPDVRELEDAKKHNRMDQYGFWLTSATMPEPKNKESEKTTLKREAKCLKFLKTWDVLYTKNFDKLQDFCDKGIPNKMRGEIWKRLARVEELRSNAPFPMQYYLSSTNTQPAIIDQIERDLHRTMPTHYYFSEDGGPGQQALYNVLRSFSVYNAEIGYCQGMGFITALALMYMPEDDAFWFLMRLTEDYNMGGLWLPDMPMIHQHVYMMDVLMAEHLPKVNAVFEENHLEKLLFVPHFFITGFMYSLPFGVALRIWDSFLSRDFDFLYAVALAIFKVFEADLVKMDLEDLMTFLKFTNNCDKENIPQFDADQLIEVALSFRLKPERLRQIDGEYFKVRDRKLREKKAADRERALRAELQRQRDEEERLAHAAEATAESTEGDTTSPRTPIGHTPRDESANSGATTPPPPGEGDGTTRVRRKGTHKKSSALNADDAAPPKRRHHHHHRRDAAANGGASHEHPERRRHKSSSRSSRRNTLDLQVTPEVRGQLQSAIEHAASASRSNSPPDDAAPTSGLPPSALSSSISASAPSVSASSALAGSASDGTVGSDGGTPAQRFLHPERTTSGMRNSPSAQDLMAQPPRKRNIRSKTAEFSDLPF